MSTLKTAQWSRAIYLFSIPPLFPIFPQAMIVVVMGCVGNVSDPAHCGEENHPAMIVSLWLRMKTNLGCVGWTWHKFNCSFHSHSTLKSTNVLSSTGSQELVVRGTLRQGCGRSIQTSYKAGVGVQSFTLIQFSVGRISSPFSEKFFYYQLWLFRFPDCICRLLCQPFCRPPLPWNNILILVAWHW